MRKAKAKFKTIDARRKGKKAELSKRKVKERKALTSEKESVESGTPPESGTLSGHQLPCRLRQSPPKDSQRPGPAPLAQS